MTSLEDLKGKKIAYSPGQAQGALVLRALDKAGLSQDDVELVEIQSVDDVYVNVLGSKEVDVAPLGGTLLTSYLAKYGQDGGTSIPTGIRDDQSLLYAPVETTEDEGKAAALAKYVVVWAKAKQWINEHPDEYAQAFYVDHEGLTLEDGLALIEQTGQLEVPLDWDETIAAHQATADLLAKEQDHDELDVADALRPPLREGHRRRPRRWRLMTTVLERPTAAADAPVVDKRVVRRRLGPGKRIPFSLAIGPILLVGLWCLLSWTGRLDPRTLSEPWVVVQTARDLIESGRLQDALKTSAVRAFAGLGLGTLIGTILALLSGLSRAGEAVIDGPVQVKRAIPTLALLPLLVLWLGISEQMKIITIALAVMLPVYIHTHNGLRSIDGRYAELAETVDIRRPEFIRAVVLPGAMPGFLLGMRFAVTTALLSLVVVEQINSTSGIGYMITLASHYGQTEVIVVGLVVYALLGLSADGFVRLIERKALAWRRTLGS